MKKNKLSLNDLKIKSFVTSIEDKKHAVIGGAVATLKLDCLASHPIFCA